MEYYLKHRRDILFISLVFIIILPIFFTSVASFSVFEIGGNFRFGSTIGYTQLFDEPTRFKTLFIISIRSIINAVLATLIALPISYIIFRNFSVNGRYVSLYLLSIPFFVNESVRVFSWNSIIGGKGIINEFLRYFDIINAPITFISNSYFAVQLVMLFGTISLSVFILIIYLSRIDSTIWLASNDLGATQPYEFKNLVLPSLKSGIWMSILVNVLLGFSKSREAESFSGSSTHSISVLINDLLSATKISSAFALGTIFLLLLLLVSTIILISMTLNNYVRKKREQHVSVLAE